MVEENTISNDKLDELKFRQLLLKESQSEIEKNIIKKIVNYGAIVVAILGVAGFFGLKQITTEYADEKFKKVAIAEINKKLSNIISELNDVSLKSTQDVNKYLHLTKEKVDKEINQFQETLKDQSDRKIEEYIKANIDVMLEADIKEIIERKYTKSIDDQVDFTVLQKLSQLFVSYGSEQKVSVTVKKMVEESTEIETTKKQASRNTRQKFTNNYAIQLASNTNDKHLLRVWNIATRKNKNNLDALKICSPITNTGTYVLAIFPDKEKEFETLKYYQDKYFIDAKAIRLKKLNQFHKCFKERA